MIDVCLIAHNLGKPTQKKNPQFSTTSLHSN